MVLEDGKANSAIRDIINPLEMPLNYACSRCLCGMPYMQVNRVHHIEIEIPTARWLNVNSFSRNGVNEWGSVCIKTTTDDARNIGNACREVHNNNRKLAAKSEN